MKNLLIVKFLLVLASTILMLFSLQACQDIVDVDLPNDRINQEDVFKDISTTKSALSFLYSKVRDAALFSKSNAGLNYNLSLYTDQTKHIGTVTNNFYLNTIQASSSEIEQWWNNAYQNIYAINSFISSLTNSSYIKEVDKKQFLAEAYTLRAMYYQNLVQLFGPIPYTLSTEYKYNTTIKKTQSYDVLLLIEKDLLYAYENLDYKHRSTERFYINKTIAELLLSYNYLLLKRYDKAEFYSKAIVENPIYQLEDDLNKIFKKDAKSTLWQLSPNLNTAITPEASTYQLKTISSYSVEASQELLDLFSVEDLRYHKWLNKVTLNNQEFYQIFKYKNTSNNTDEVSISYRLEEAYFNLSLSLVLQDKTEEAIAILNIIRQKRGLDNLSPSIDKTTFINQYLDESSREFFTENGRRLFDLKLTDNLQQLSKAKPNWKANHDLFPIPEKQLQINKNLTPQNTGY